MRHQKWVALAAGMFSGAAAADVVISNHPGNDIIQSGLLQAGRIKAMGFTMPAAAREYALDDIVVRLNCTTTGVVPLIRIFDDVGGFPTNELVTLDVPPVTQTGILDYPCTPPGTFLLLPGRTYWLVVYNVGTTNMDWMANNPGITPTGVATHAGTYFSASAGPNPPFGRSTILTTYFVNASLARCAPDLTGSSDPNDPTYGQPDGILDAADFFYFLDQFAAGNLAAADLSGSTDPNDPGYGNPDGVLDAADFFFYLDAFAEGCR